MKVKAYSETKAAFPRTVSRTMRYKVVPQNQWPESKPSDCLRSPQNRMIENPYVIFREKRDQCPKSMGANRTYQTVVQRVHDPEPESGFCEEHILLTQGVELRIPI